MWLTIDYHRPYSQQGKWVNATLYRVAGLPSLLPFWLIQYTLSNRHNSNHICYCPKLLPQPKNWERGQIFYWRERKVDIQFFTFQVQVWRLKEGSENCFFFFVRVIIVWPNFHKDEYITFPSFLKGNYPSLSSKFGDLA